MQMSSIGTVRRTAARSGSATCRSGAASSEAPITLSRRWISSAAVNDAPGGADAVPFRGQRRVAPGLRRVGEVLQVDGNGIRAHFRHDVVALGFTETR